MRPGPGSQSLRQPSLQRVKSKPAGETPAVALCRKEQNSALFPGLAQCLQGSPGGGEFATVTLRSRGRDTQHHFVITSKIHKIYGHIGTSQLSFPA